MPLEILSNITVPKQCVQTTDGQSTRGSWCYTCLEEKKACLRLNPRRRSGADAILKEPAVIAVIGHVTEIFALTDPINRAFFK
ncbi:hypothetical protein RvY_11191 [Ramazzottius varieornatus]|uniref:Uncharacterized protein n=1 Tax=Ramazzottius varieornatus TaxID=947166 RepID=A0A1D1VN24_RAMVA|nr:hypothetical protein RvY_11191 [Ramazzottius varieornatus]